MALYEIPVNQGISELTAPIAPTGSTVLSCWKQLHPESNRVIAVPRSCMSHRCLTAAS